jgi:hypothetical protein
METNTEKVDLEKLSSIDIIELTKNGYSVNHLLQQYKDYVFEKHKDSSLAVKWACYAGTLEGILNITLNILKNDTRF